MPPNVMAAAMPGMPSMGSHGLLPAQHLHGPGRHLQILDHTVHRIDAQRKPNGEQDNEMVVSNLRHFTLKVGVLDPHQGIGREADLPLKAELLYENGQPVRVTILRGRARIPHLYLSLLLRRQDRSPLVAACPACARAYTLLSPVWPLQVEQLATCEPLLVGKTEVTAMQGSAMFKLRITSLSSHRDKQRFRIRVSPQDMGLLVREPGLAVVTTPMKCVTKLTHRSSAGMKHESTEEADGEEAEGSAGAGPALPPISNPPLHPSTTYPLPSRNLPLRIPPFH